MSRQGRPELFRTLRRHADKIVSSHIECHYMSSPFEALMTIIKPSFHTLLGQPEEVCSVK